MSAYFDVTKTFLFWKGPPTGIQRAIYELCDAGKSRGVSPVVVHPVTGKLYRLEHFNATSQKTPSPPSRKKRALEFIKGKKAALYQMAPLFIKSLWRKCGLFIRSTDAVYQWTLAERFKELERNGKIIDLKPGDSLYILGINHNLPNYPSTIRSLKERVPEIEIVSLIHDIFPITHSEYCDPTYRRLFSEWISFLEEVSDRVITNSREVALSLSGNFHGKQIEPIRFGSVVVRPPTMSSICVSDLEKALAPHLRVISPEALSTLHQKGSWILTVGTMERRKNQQVQLDALKVLWESGELDLPLILVGRVHTETTRFRTQIDSDPTLARFVILVESPIDDVLWKLYRGARFTILSSLYEGFGLTVSESLQFGTPCLASSAGAIREVAGNLTEYFDPKSPAELTNLVRRFVTDSNFEKTLRLRAQEFRAHTWTEAVIDILGS